LFLERLGRPLARQDIAHPVYDFGTDSRNGEIKAVIPQPLLLFEGILLSAIPEIRNQIVSCIFVDKPGERAYCPAFDPAVASQ
jgi:uridine kinase